MKIIHHPETCPLCEYSRQGLEPGRPCPECGVGLFPDAPVFDFSVSRRLLGLPVLIGCVELVAALLLGYARASGWKMCVPFLLMLAIGQFWTAWIIPTIRLRAMFSLREIVFVRRGRVRWRLPYDDLVGCKGRWPMGAVILRERRRKRRKLPAWKRKNQRAVIPAIDDVLARYHKENEVHSPTRAAGFSLRGPAVSRVSPQCEEQPAPMKIIHDPEDCPLCEYSREGLETKRPCPECGVGLLPGAPVFDLSPVVWQVRLGALAIGSLALVLSVAILADAKNIRQAFPPGIATFPLFGFFIAAWSIWVAFRKPLPTLLLFTIDGISFLYRGRVRWHIRYDAVTEHKGIRLLRVVILRDATGKRRTLTTETRKEQAAIMRAIADVLARYRRERDAEEPLPDGRGSDGAHPHLQ